MPILDSGAERLSPGLPRRFAVGGRLIPAMLVLAAANLGIAVEPAVVVLDDHAFQINGREDLSCFDGETLSASSEVITDVIAYWNTDTKVGQVIAVDGAEALASAGAVAPTDTEVGAALPDSSYPWIRLGRVQFSANVSSAITIDEIDHGVRAFEITTSPKAAGLASSSHENDPIGDAELYEYLGEISIEVDAADLADSDILTDFPLPLHHGKIGRFRAVVTKAITTAAKACDLDLEIGAVAVTGGQVALAGAMALGAIEEGAAITAANVFKPGDNLSIIGSSTTTFIEGRVKLVAEVYKLIS